MSFTSVVFAGAVKAFVPTAMLPGAVSAVQVDVGSPLESVPHTCAVKPVVLAESTSTPVRVYPDAFEPVVNPCAIALEKYELEFELWPTLLTRASAGGVTGVMAARVTVTV